MAGWPLRLAVARRFLRSGPERLCGHIPTSFAIAICTKSVTTCIDRSAGAAGPASGSLAGQGLTGGFVSIPSRFAVASTLKFELAASGPSAFLPDSVAQRSHRRFTFARPIRCSASDFTRMATWAEDDSRPSLAVIVSSSSPL